MTDYQYELKDVDEQVGEYDYLLLIYSPMGLQPVAIDHLAVTADGEDNIGLSKEGEVVTQFSKHMPFLLLKRERLNKLSREDIHDRNLEYESAVKLYQKRRENLFGGTEY